MFSEFRNFLLKTSALIGCTATLLYFAPRLTNTITEEPLDEDQIEQPTRVVQEERLKKYQNRRKPSSIESSKEVSAQSLPSKTSDGESNQNNFKDSAEDIRAQMNTPYQTLSNTSSQRNTLEPGDNDNARNNQLDSQEESRNSRRRSNQANLDTSSSLSTNDALTSNSVADDDTIYGVAGCGTDCDSSDTDTDTDTDSETTTSSSSTTSSASTTELERPVVSADLGAGNYAANPSVSLSSNIGGEIYYCLAQGSCCDPEPSSGGLAYSAPISVGSGDGNYCLSFVGVSSVGLMGDSVTQSYLVDQTLPNMTSVVDVQYIQTTQESSISINSTDFGSSGFDYGLYNLNSDPSAINCKQVEENFAHASYGVDLDGDTSPDLYDLSSIFTTITSPLKPSIMQYGPTGNYFVSILSNRNSLDEAKRNCVTHKVILQDFDYLIDSQISTSVPVINGSGNIEFSGSFNSYGIFREPAAIGDNSITSGSSRYEADTSNILESSTEEIIN